MARRIGTSPFGLWCGNVGDVLDCVIPIVLVVVIIIGLGSIALGFVH
jgi:hypothetical protein